MSSIKIIHNNTARRFTVTDTTQWSEITERVSSLFQLRPSSSIVFSYVDSDNDVVTLSTTVELQEALTQGINKFNIVISGSDSSSDDWVMPGSETPRTIESALESFRVAETPVPETSAPFLTEPVRDAAAAATAAASPSLYQTTIEETEDLPQYHEEERPTLNKGKEKEETGESSRTGATHNENTDGDEAFQFQQIQEQLQKLCEQFKDVIEQNPQLLETANTLMEQLIQHIPVDLDIFATFLNGARNDGQRGPVEFAFHPGSPFARGPFGRGPFGTGFRGHHQFGMMGTHPFGAHPCGSRGGFRGGFRGGCGAERWRQCQEKDSGDAETEECHAKHEGWIRNRRAACEERRREAATRAEQDVKTKIESLNAMGFYETFTNESFEELLSRYGGNVERVVEVLVQRQQGMEAIGEKVKGYDF